MYLWTRTEIWQQRHHITDCPLQYDKKELSQLYLAPTTISYTYLDERDSPMKTSLRALTGKRCGPETSDPANIEYDSFEVVA